MKTSLKRYALAFALASLFATASETRAASVTIIFNITGPNSTSVTCPTQASYQVPVAVGTVMCTAAVQPSTWNGSLAIGGADAAFFTMSGMSITVAQQITAVRPYTITLTATP